VDQTRGEEAVKTIQKDGGEAIFIKTNVSSASEVESLVRNTVQKYGRLDCAFNNAGIVGDTATTIECTEGNWDNVININLKGIWLCMKYEIPVMLKQGKGAIVNTSSILGVVGTDKRPPYVASKHGIIGITKAAAIEFAKSGIRVNAVCPGPTDTGLSPTALHLATEDPSFKAAKEAEIPMNRMGLPEEIAEAVVWLCSDAASFVTGLAMPVDGGLTSW